MNIFSHILIVATYAVIAVFVMVMAPDIFPELEAVGARFLGGAVFLLGVQFHAIYVWRMSRQDFQNRLLALHQDYQVTQDRLEESDREVSYLRGEVEKTGQATHGDIVAEMRVLQTLLGQVSEKSGKKLPRRQRGGGQKGGESALSALESGKAPLRPQQDREERKEGDILNIMNYALEENRVDLYLQPIVSLPSRRVVHYEAYSRVRDDQDNVIFPSEYLKLAEDTGLVGTLDNLLLFRCIQVIRRLGPRRPGIRFFCNISSVSLNDKEFFPQFIDFMLDNLELADRLVFEFSQQDVMRHSPAIWRTLANLGRRGFRFSMDNVLDTNVDLADLSARYFHYVKLDAKLLLGVGNDIDPDDIKEAYSRYDIDLIVEKIEDDNTIVEVLDYGVDYGQGYLFGEPKISSDASMGL